MAKLRTKKSPKGAIKKGSDRSKKLNGITKTSPVNNKSNSQLNSALDDSTVTQKSDRRSKNTVPRINILTRSKSLKNKGDLELMDFILKTELMIKDSGNKHPSRKAKGLNNNNEYVCDQNTAVPPNSCRAKKTDKQAKRKRSNSPKELDNFPNLDSMEQYLREDVLNNMKSKLSPDDEFFSERNSKSNNCRPFKQKETKSVRKTQKVVNVSNNLRPKKRKIDTDVSEKSQSSDTKQVRLSNGVILTLALLKCDHCQKTFSSKSSLTRHMFVHIKLRPHPCPECPKKFRYKKNLKVHVEKYHSYEAAERANHICQICDRVFVLAENLELHLETHMEPDSKFKCLYCDKKFSYRLLLIKHENSHLVKGRFKCYICESTFVRRNLLSNHVKIHSANATYMCQHCGNDFTRFTSLRRHIQVCHGGQTIQCPICKKKLKGHLSEHMRLHDKKRPHVCKCGQRFTQATQLRVHERCHTGLRPYCCRICKSAFGHSSALMSHIRIHTGEKPFMCAMCPLSFSQIPHMKCHMRRIHGKENAYKCPKCKNFFKKKAQLASHLTDCSVGEDVQSDGEGSEASVKGEIPLPDSFLSLSKMRFHVALLITMIATKSKLKVLGFNKRLIDDILVDSVEAMGYVPCKNEDLSPLKRLKNNVDILLRGTIPQSEMQKFLEDKKTVEELLVMLTKDEKSKKKKDKNK